MAWRRFIAFAGAGLVLIGCGEERSTWEARTVEIRLSADAARALREDGPEFADLLVRMQIHDSNAQTPQNLAVVYSKGVHEDERDDCTGFFVSKDVVLTAGHCATKGEIWIRLAGKLRRASCSRREDATPAEDWAVCTLDGGEIEDGWLALTRCLPAKDSPTLVLGYCNPQSVLNAGLLLAGEPTNGFVPLLAPEGSQTVVCVRDSGGPALFTEGAVQRDGRWIAQPGAAFGVISRGVTSTEEPCHADRASCIATFHTDRFAEFFRQASGLELASCAS